ncbi:hypothetical protein EES42_41600 [Streptomyces sp. ADI95-17]|nr:hypothetical protein EES42_41600 [Streptomyces sp. ADI95-17]
MRRGSTNSVGDRRAMMLPASAGGSRVPVSAHLVQADEGTVRDVIHRVNEIGLACLDLQRAGGRPRLLSADDEDFVIRTATTCPIELGQPFTRWSLCKLVARLRNSTAESSGSRGVTFQRIKTCKESFEPDREAKRDRIEEVLDRFPDRDFAFDEFGPLGIRPTAGSGWADEKPRPATRRLSPRSRRAPLSRLLLARRRHPVWRQLVQEGRRQYLGRAEIDPGHPARRRPDLRDPRQPVCPQAHRDPLLGQEEQTRVVLHPPLRLMDEPDRSPLRTASTVHYRQLHPPRPHCPDPGPARLPPLAQRQHPPPDVLAAQHRERARIRGEKGIRWGGCPLQAA